MTTRTRRAVNLLGIAVVAVLVWLFLWPAALGGSMTYIAVSGPSMEPTYSSGDFVVARAQNEYEVGDVVVFATESGNVIHRIVGGDGESGFVMQGDNNPEIDQWTPTNDEVLGEAVLHVPGAGDAVLLVRQVLITPPFPYLLAAFVFLIIVLEDDKKKTRRSRSEVGAQPLTDEAGSDVSVEDPHRAAEQDRTKEQELIRV